MAESYAFECYGVPILLEVEDRRQLARLEPYLPPIRQACSEPTVRTYRLASPQRGRYLLSCGDDLLVDGLWRYACNSMEQHLSLYLAEHAAGRILVHAGVVGYRGRALIAPGHSRAGKSHLVKYLVEHGADYYSDEFAVLDPQGWVHPYPRYLSLRRPGGRTQRVDPHSLGRVGVVPLKVAMVLLTRFNPGGVYRPRPLEDGLAVLEVLKYTVAARSRAQEAFQTLAHSVRGATVLKGTRGEIAEFGLGLLQQLDDWDDS